MVCNSHGHCRRHSDDHGRLTKKTFVAKYIFSQSKCDSASIYYWTYWDHGIIDVYCSDALACLEKSLHFWIYFSKWGPGV